MKPLHPHDTLAVEAPFDGANPRTALHIAWTAFQRRQVSMASICGFETVFLPFDKSVSRLRKTATYLSLALRTWRLLWAHRPQVVWVQLPQVPLLWVVLAYRRLRSETVRVVADCHNGQLRPPWSDFPLLRWTLRRADAVLVHNADMARQAEALGWPMARVRVMEDVPPLVSAVMPSSLARRQIQGQRPWVVLPGSFSADEPIAEVLQAARLAPDITFVITGRTQNAARHGHDLSKLPPNVRTPGYLPVDAFEDLLREADCVLALTREEGIQLSVCNEALGFGRAMVASDTAVLRRLFAEAAVMVATGDPESLVAACRQALAQKAQREEASRFLAQKRRAQWQAGPWAELKRLLNA